MNWPRKLQLLGIKVSATTYDESVAAIEHAAKHRLGGAVGALAVHPVVHGTLKHSLGEQLNQLDLCTPDGQGSRWALNWLYGTGLKDRVYGPELMLRTCAMAARENLAIYLYGGEPAVVAKLKEVLVARYPGLKIAGAYSPPFRPLTPEEVAQDVATIRESGAAIVFIGLGAPRQEQWVVRHRPDLDAVLVATGAAFDFISGHKPQAPRWMQRVGLEMVFRTLTEPRRLWKRFLFFSPTFVFLVFFQKLRLLRVSDAGAVLLCGFRLGVQ